MLWTPLDLLLSIGGSETALREELVRVKTTLRAMQEGLVLLASAGPDEALGKAKFCNAASDFFCHVQVATAGPRSQLQALETGVETVLAGLRSGARQPEKERQLLQGLEALLLSTANP